MTFRLGLTGSIGMGKSTTAQLFVDQGCAVWDADAAVHRLYSEGGAAVASLDALGLDVVQNGSVNRAALRSAIQSDPDLIKTLEDIVHPLVRADRETFFSAATEAIVVFDIPLLFETGSQDQMDAVVCVTVSPDVQRQRVLDRGTMSEDDLRVILERQMPNDEKVQRSDYVVQTDTLDHAKRQVSDIIADIKRKLEHA